MAFDLFPSIMESFIYNYADNTWHRYLRGTDGEVHLEENKDYSQVLRCHLHTLLTQVSTLTFSKSSCTYS